MSKLFSCVTGKKKHKEANESIVDAPIQGFEFKLKKGFNFTI